MEMQKKQDFLTTVKAAIAAMIDVCGDNIYLLYETAHKAAYQQGYDDGRADALNPETVKLTEQEKPQPETELEKPAAIDGPENYRHALAEPGRTACGIIMPEIVKLEIADGNRVTCPKCKEAVAAYQTQIGPLT